MAESYLANGPKSTTSADRYQVVVHVSAETLKKERPAASNEDVSAENTPVGARPTGDQAQNPARSPESCRVGAHPTGDPPRTEADVSAETRQSPLSDGGVSAETADLFATDFSYIDDGPHVSAATARRLSCDASKIDVTDDEDGEPLNIGRKSRLIPPAMRRALRMRDDGCRFPGCTHKCFIDGRWRWGICSIREHCPLTADALRAL